MRSPISKLAACAVAVLLTACGDEQVATSTSASPTENARPAITVPSGRLQGLSITLELEADQVRSGEEVEAWYVVQNKTDEVISDLGCTLANIQFGLVPALDPDAELWGRQMTDCSGDPFPMEPGFDDRWSAASFPASDGTGKPLAPGHYLATIQAGDHIRLSAPIEVTLAD